MAEDTLPRKIEKFDLNKLYVGVLENNLNKYIILYEKENGQYLNLLSVNRAVYEEQKIYSKSDIIELIPFFEYVEDNNLSVMLMDANANTNNVLTKDNIFTIMKIIKERDLLSKSEIDGITRNCNHSARVISDLLGLNANDYPSSSIKAGTRQDVIVPANKVLLFRKTIEQYLYADLVIKESVIITNENDVRDYRISRSLKNSNIIINDAIKNNTFSVVVERDTIKPLPDWKSEKGKQKIFKLR